MLGTNRALGPYVAGLLEGDGRGSALGTWPGMARRQQCFERHSPVRLVAFTRSPESAQEPVRM